MYIRFLSVSLICLIAASGCKQGSGEVTKCSFYTEHFGGNTAITISPGQKGAQRFRVNKDVKLKSLTLEMELHTSTSVTLSLLEAASGAGTPAGGTILGQRTIVSSQVTNSGKIRFDIPTSSVFTGADYYMTIEPFGGDIELTDQSAAPFSVIGEVWREGGGTWSSFVNWDLSFSAAGECL